MPWSHFPVKNDVSTWITFEGLCRRSTGRCSASPLPFQEDWNDQQIDETVPVEVHFKIDPIKGSTLKGFVDAFHWSDLRGHLKGVPEKRARGIHEFLTQLQEDKELLLLTVEDRNTQGLTGED